MGAVELILVSFWIDGEDGEVAFHHEVRALPVFPFRGKSTSAPILGYRSLERGRVNVGIENVAHRRVL